MEDKLNLCPNCGKPGKVRYRMPYTWVECKKKCGARTGYYIDGYEQCDIASRIKAIAEWNSLKSKNG